MPSKVLDHGNSYSKGKSDLGLFFEPKSVAVFGSMKEGFFGGYVVVKTLLDAGYNGKIYPINPGYQEVLGVKVYPSIRDVPAAIDLGLMIINSRGVPQLMWECSDKGVKAVIVVADGFAERSEQGAVLQKEIVEIGRRAGMRILGPNTAGVVNAANGFIPCPYAAGYDKIKSGGIAICTQTGLSNPQAFPYKDLHYGVSKICDFGNKCDVDECDMLEYLEGDPATKVISMYLESVRDGRRFLEISKRVASKKPVLVLKSGRTREGARVSASHTGSLAVNDQIFDAACKQASVIRLEKLSELFELPKLFANQPLPRGNGLGIISFTGGVGVLATDEGLKYGLSVATLSPETASRLNAMYQGLGSTIVDVGPAMVTNDYTSFYPEVVETVLADKNVDCLLNVMWLDPFGSLTEGYVRIYRELLKTHQKPIATWIFGPSFPAINELSWQLEDLGFPVFRDVEMGIKALGIAYQYGVSKKKRI